MSKPVRYEVYFHRGDELALMNVYRSEGGFRRKMREMARYTPHVGVYVWDRHYKMWAKVRYGSRFIWAMDEIKESEVPCLKQPKQRSDLST